MKIPVLHLPWRCWKCNNEMKVTYPTDEHVLGTELKGNLEWTYSRTMSERLVGNICPLCGQYQGNFFVQDRLISTYAYEIEKYLVGYLDLTVDCLRCRRKIEARLEDTIPNNDSELWEILNYYDEWKDLRHQDAAEQEEGRERVLSIPYHPNWMCRECQILVEQELLEGQKRLERERAEERRRRKVERVNRAREGPLESCTICGVDTFHNSETRLVEHHLSYLKEETILVCDSCHRKIHSSSQYEQYKPMDTRIGAERAREEIRVRMRRTPDSQGLYHCWWCRCSFFSLVDLERHVVVHERSRTTV